MLTESKSAAKIKAIKEVIRLLNLALDNCHKALAEAEASARCSLQDNEPVK